MPTPINLPDDEYDIGAAVIEHGTTDWEIREWDPPVNPSQAASMLRHLRRVRAEQETVAKRYDELRNQLDAWLEDVSAGLESQAEHLVHHLEGWYEGQGHTKPVKFPTGTLRSRKGSAGLEITDEDALLEWIHDNGKEAWLRVVEKPVKTEIKRDLMPVELGDKPGIETRGACTEDGELIPGVRWTTSGRRTIVDVTVGSEDE